MSKRVHNFYAGPATLPLEVVQKAQKGLDDFAGQGMSIMEISHRSKPFEAMFKNAQSKMLSIMGLSPDDYYVLFLGGGASMQFCMVPFNFLRKDETADYINTGGWSTGAIKEARLFGTVNTAATSEDTNFDRIPTEFKLTPGAAYVHTTSNNTLYGTQIWNFPDTGAVPHVCDMSSDFLSRELDFSSFSLIYAGAQKNIGPSGVTAVIVRKSWLDSARTDIPTMMKYKVHVEKESLYNTPPCFPVFVVDLVMDWIMENGGLAGVERRNKRKAALIYDAIDKSGGFYRPHVKNPKDRSLMNITFTLPSEELEGKFVEEAKKLDMVGLKGHRSVGGCRASTYNAMTIEGAEALAAFMAAFMSRNG